MKQPVHPDEETLRDQKWMQLAAHGDMDAFQQLVECHQARVVGTIAKMLGDSDEAEDLAQQVFVRVWKSAKRYKPTAKFTTWLMTITRNLVFNEIRRRKRHPSQNLDSELADHDPQLIDHQAASPAEQTLQHELQSKIQQAIESLPENQRMAIVLRRYENMPYEDIARILKLTVPSVKSLLFRARTFLKEQLGEYLSG